MSAERLGAALAVSLLLHAAALDVLERLPRGWLAKEPFTGTFGPGALRASLRTATADAELTMLPGRSSDRAKPSRPEGLVVPHAYYSTNLLDEPPQVRVHVDPAFPLGAPDTGRVMLRLFIGTDGLVEEIVVEESEPPGIFERAAAQAFAAAQFTPGKIRGEAVKTLMTIEVLFGAPLPAQ